MAWNLLICTSTSYNNRRHQLNRREDGTNNCKWQLFSYYLAWLHFQSFYFYVAVLCSVVSTIVMVKTIFKMYGSTSIQKVKYSAAFAELGSGQQLMLNKQTKIR